MKIPSVNYRRTSLTMSQTFNSKKSTEILGLKLTMIFHEYGVYEKRRFLLKITGVNLFYLYVH